MTFKNSQDSDWCLEEHAVDGSTKLPYEVIELNDPFKEALKEEQHQLLKEQLVGYFNDCFTSSLSPEDIVDCLRASCSSSLDYAKSEYEKYAFIAKQLGIE